MILVKSNGVNCGVENYPRDIRLRNIGEHGSAIHMHIQHPSACVLSDPIEFDATQARELAAVLIRLADGYDEANHPYKTDENIGSVKP